MTVVPMTTEQAAEYLRWTYPTEYAFYNIPEEHIAEAMKEMSHYHYFSVLDHHGGLYGFFEYTLADDGTMEIGLGIRPEDCGAGQGEAFVRRCIEFGRAYYDFHGTITLRVADFNHRAKTVYERIGFVQIGSEQAVSYGTPVTFLVMELKI